MICSKFPHEINAKTDLPGTFIIFICEATLRGKAKFRGSTGRLSYFRKNEIKRTIGKSYKIIGK